jgi:hypothetical protein
MCWSLEVSVITGLVSYSIALYLWMRNDGPDQWLAITLFTFSTIQWAEALLWYDEDKNKLESKSCLNKITTQYAIPIILASEGLANLYGAYLAGHNVNNQTFAIYICITIMYFMWINKRSTATTLSKEHNLKWFSDNSIIECLVFFLILTYPFFKYYENTTSLTLIIVSVFLLLMYSFTKDSFGSNWCFLANILSIIALFRPYIDKQK